MDRNRLLIFFVLSAAILAVSQLVLPHPPARPPVHQVAAVEQTTQPSAAGQQAAPALPAAPSAPDTRAAPRAKIDGARLVGSISLIGARVDEMALKDYHDTIQKSSPLVQLLAPADDAQPSSIQIGWAAGKDVKVPDDTTLWASSGGDLSGTHPLTLSWDNGQGLTFRIDFSIDKNYMFTVHQSVHNAGDKPADLWPWQRIRRDYTQRPAASYAAFEGMLGAADGRTHQLGFPKVRTEAAKNDGVAYTHEGAGGWTSFCDKYWLTAIIPDQAVPMKTLWFYNNDDGRDHYQVSAQTSAPTQVNAGADASFDSHLFVGAKEVRLLAGYETDLNIPLLTYSVDWGWFFFLSKPFFYAIDWINSVTHNFGVAILIFTVLVKILFYPLARKSFESMGKMRLLAPKIQAARERHKDDPAKQQAAMMEVYKQEGISPAAQAGGCLPMVIQIPVFISLYNVILITIEMRQAPFFGWIHDLSVIDPTNIFTLFGLLPYSPELISPYLHLGVWPVLMGCTMFFQQKLNPPPPDPVQARMFQYMPIFFTFLMGRAPAGLVIYWTWNNLLTMLQQWHIQRHVTLDKKG
jgi:YidC/Oxa1 family membrane protein insertase